MESRQDPQEVFDSIRRQKFDTGLQPFKLVKYFSFTSLGVILVFTLILSWIISNHARRVMLEQSQEYVLLLAENINQQVFRRFVLPAVVRYGGIALSNPEQFENLDRIVRGLIQGLKIDSVTIFDSRVNIISYSTVPELVGVKDKGGVEYEQALKGKANSRFIYRGSVFSLLSVAPAVRCQLRAYIPFRQVREDGESGEVIMGVIEIVKDLSNNYASIIDLQSRIILVSAAVMGVLFLVLRTIVSRAGRIMESKALERLRLEEKLNQTERLAHLGTMVATVSHEIKSPLGIVRSTAEILEKRIQKVAPGNEHLARIIVDETTRLNNIVVEFLDFARPQQMKMERGQINAIIDKVLAFLAPMFREQQVNVIADLAPDLPETAVDVDKVYRALLNILLNATQAMEHGGTLQISTGSSDGGRRIEIVIGDSGCGMDEDKLTQIFKPFFTDKNKGTGLGLAITKNIIEGHLGEILVASRPGEGTTFTIRLPVA
ncbi:MAG: ATP-binding protein [Desulfoprunum sp.]|jgi:signal transduction histidine kinase|uniref:two-component system sensor histidine kinase NtrB n=1 Tax=Desulfoprunum sp. TaxID=2020866 RepID=UPI003C788AEE